MGEINLCTYYFCICGKNALCSSRDMPTLIQIIGVKILRIKLYLLPFMALMR